MKADSNKNQGVFHREDLAESIAKRVLNARPGSASSSGLFLSAPRRTGKSTFIREDLRPVILNAGAIVIYTDLWANKKADPGMVIISAIKSELAKYDGVVKRLARSAGMDKVTVGGMSFLLDRVGLENDISLSDALSALSDETEKPIVLIIDEAQHAITTNNGSDALFALKAARDEVNSSMHNGLHIIATGSSQSKLAMLRNNREQAFFGAHIFQFPHLNEKYIEWFCENSEIMRNINTAAVMELFKKTSYRPEMLGAAEEALLDEIHNLKDNEILDRFSEKVIDQINGATKELLRTIHSLTPLQYAVLKVLSISGEDYAPFESDTLVQYKAVLNDKHAGKVNVDVASVQQALIALQEKSLVWKASRGVYALEDTSVVEAFVDTAENDGGDGSGDGASGGPSFKIR